MNFRKFYASDIYVLNREFVTPLNTFGSSSVTVNCATAALSVFSLLEREVFFLG